MNRHKLVEDMNVSENAVKLREAIDKATEDGFITREEYDRIITIAAADGEIDAQEQVILKEFHQMIFDREIKIKRSEL
jgi:tellurite resistance protein